MRKKWNNGNCKDFHTIRKRVLKTPDRLGYSTTIKRNYLDIPHSLHGTAL
jgi:hypothetical protein